MLPVIYQNYETMEIAQITEILFSYATEHTQLPIKVNMKFDFFLAFFFKPINIGYSINT